MSLWPVCFAMPAPHASDYLYVWAMETHDASVLMPPSESMGRDGAMTSCFNLGQVETR